MKRKRKREDWQKNKTHTRAGETNLKIQKITFLSTGSWNIFDILHCISMQIDYLAAMTRSLGKVPIPFWSQGEKKKQILGLGSMYIIRKKIDPLKS